MAQSIQSESMHLITTDAPEPDSRGLDHAMSQQRALLQMSPLHVLMDPRIIGERSDAVLRTAMPGHDTAVVIGHGGSLIHFSNSAFIQA